MQFLELIGNNILYNMVEKKCFALFCQNCQFFGCTPRLKIPPKKWLTDEGYSVVCNKKMGHQSTDLKTASSSRVYVNSGRQLRTSQKYTLRIRIRINLSRKI